MHEKLDDSKLHDNLWGGERERWWWISAYNTFILITVCFTLIIVHWDDPRGISGTQTSRHGAYYSDLNWYTINKNVIASIWFIFFAPFISQRWKFLIKRKKKNFLRFYSRGDIEPYKVYKPIIRWIERLLGGSGTRQQFGNQRRKYRAARVRARESFRKRTWSRREISLGTRRRPLAKRGRRISNIFSTPPPTSPRATRAVCETCDPRHFALTSRKCNAGNWQAICVRILAWKWKFGSCEKTRRRSDATTRGTRRGVAFNPLPFVVFQMAPWWHVASCEFKIHELQIVLTVF